MRTKPVTQALVSSAVVVLACVLLLTACAPPETVTAPPGETTPAPSPTPTPKPEFKPNIVTFPFSWEEDEKGYLTEITEKPGIIEVTVHKIKALGTGTLEEIGLGGIQADKGYQFYGVYITFKNLMHKQWSSPYGVYVGALLELETNRGNIYRSGGIPRVIDLRPEQAKDCWDYFEIRVDEKPTQLRHYDIINPNDPSSQQKLAIVFIWEIE